MIIAKLLKDIGLVIYLVWQCSPRPLKREHCTSHASELKRLPVKIGTDKIGTDKNPNPHLTLGFVGPGFDSTVDTRHELGTEQLGTPTQQTT